MRLMKYADIEESGVRLRLTVVDTPGYGDFINNEDGSVSNPFILQRSSNQSQTFE